MSRAVGIKGRGTEMCSVLVGRAEGIIRPGFGQANIKEKKKLPKDMYKDNIPWRKNDINSKKNYI